MNREYSWLLFNRRVLEQSMDLTNPLLERCRFLSIFSSNLDEFFMVRIGSLYNASLSDPDKKDNKTQLTAKKQMEGICTEVRRYYTARSSCYYTISRELSRSGIKILSAKNLTPRQGDECIRIFDKTVRPALTVMALDAKHPFMQFENETSYMVYDIEKDGRKMLGVIGINRDLPRLYSVSSPRKKTVCLIPLEEIMRSYGHLVFAGYTINSSMMMRVTRNADFDTTMGQRDGKDYAKIMKKKVESRAVMNVVRLEIDRNNEKLRDTVLKMVHLGKQYCFRDERFFDYKFLNSVQSFMDRDTAAGLRYPPFRGAVPAEIAGKRSLIEYVLKKDIFLSYPYDSMTPFLDLLSECSQDARVRAIRITIYRLDKHSRIADILCKAAENGIDVTVVIELRARFDEENNMYFASKLQDAGCNIIYGMENYKVHSKILSVVLSTDDGIKYITHVATGNYNESTSRQYTDLNIITSDSAIGEDGDAFFRNMEKGNVEYDYESLLVAPRTLKPVLMEYMDREIDRAKSGGKGYIMCKMNSLTDREIMDKFVEASRAGVKVNLIIRGICCLLPGIEGKTENITIISIVGRFLEHSRVFRFGEGEDAVTYIGSADLMTRNTDRRVEIAAPVRDPVFAEKVGDMLDLMMRDNVKARRLGPDGVYRKIETIGPATDAQLMLLKKATEPDEKQD